MLSQHKLHEATSDAKQTVSEKMFEMVSGMKKAEIARAIAAVASTDDIRKGRAAHVFNEQLATELRDARQAAAAAKGEARG